MDSLELKGIGDVILRTDGNCIELEIDRKVKQKRIIPIPHILCVEVSEPQEGHRGYIYFRTPAANKAMKAAVSRDFVIDDDIVFFNDTANYTKACQIQQYIADAVNGKLNKPGSRSRGGKPTS